MGIDFDPKVKNGIYVERFNEEEQQEVKQQAPVTVPLEMKKNDDKKGLAVESSANYTDYVAKFKKDAAKLNEQWENPSLSNNKPLENAFVQNKKPEKQYKYEEYKLQTDPENSAKLKNARKLTDKKAIETAIREKQKQFFDNGLDGREINGRKIDWQYARELAEDAVKNDKRGEEFLSTKTFDNKEKYKEAEKQRKETRKELVKTYREQGKSRKEAKKLADAQLVENIYATRSARKEIQNHKEEYYENGELSNDKLKLHVLKDANRNNQEEGEATNYHLSLKECQKDAVEQGISAKTVKGLAKSAGMDYERDNTNLYKVLTIGGATVIGAGIGALASHTTLVGGGTVADAFSGAAAGGAAAGSAGHAAASGTTRVKHNYIGTGAAIGAGVGATIASFVKDKGRKDVHVYAPTEKPVAPPVKPPIQPPQPPKEPVKTCPEQKWEENYCDYKPKKGEYWANIVQAKYTHEDGSKITDQKELMNIVHALKIRHGITNFKTNTQPSTMRLFSELNGKTYTINCDGKVIGGNNNQTPKTPYTKYNGTVEDPYKYKQDCNDPEPVRIN